jgi:hypothetical protein
VELVFECHAESDRNYEQRLVENMSSDSEMFDPPPNIHVRRS